MKTLDLRHQFRWLYQPSAKAPVLVDVPDLLFLTVDGRIGKGETPGLSPAFQQAVQALYGAAYTLKFMAKKRKTNAVDYPVMALEAIWWVEGARFELSKPDDWSWRAMIMQPDLVTPAMFDEARATLRKKRPSPAMDLLRLERFHEGLAVQMMHVGPYSTEPATVARLQAFAAEQGLEQRRDHERKAGRLVVHDHHEIYLGDPRRSAPEKLKTVVRHPVRLVPGRASGL
jgi:hypothetical protein